MIDFCVIPCICYDNSIMTGKWPNRISNDENAEYISKIKLSYIQSAVVERNDLYYEHVGSAWFMTLDLVVDNKISSAFLWGKDSYQAIEKMLQESGEFDCYSEVPGQVGRYTYSRKTKTELTSDILKSISSDNIIYAEFADFGAMGLINYGCPDSKLTYDEDYAHVRQKTFAFQWAEPTPLFSAS